MKRVEFDGTVHEFPDDFTDQEIAQALGGGDTPSLGRRASNALGAARGAVQTGINYIDTLGGLIKPSPPAGTPLKPPTGGFLGGIADILRMGRPAPTGLVSSGGVNMPGFVTPESVNTVPRNLSEAGALTAALLTPGASNAVQRVGLQALGGEIGNQIEGGRTGRGALNAGANAALGEVTSGLAGGIARAAPGAKDKIAAQDVQDYGQEMARQSPPLAGVRTAEDLRRYAGGEGKSRLGTAKEAAVSRIEGMLPPSVALNIPALGQTVQQNVPLAGTAGYHPTATPRPFTLREANDALSEIGARAFSKNPLDRTFQGVDQRQLYGDVAQQIEGELRRRNPAAADLFSQIQDQYKSGLALLRPAESERAYRTGPSGIQFNTPYFQGYVQSPKKIAAMGNKLGDADFAALQDVLLRGAASGKDVLPAGEGAAGSAFKQWLRGGNSGSLGLAQAIIRSITPNLGAQYTGVPGRQPYTVTPQTQARLDAIVGQQTTLPPALQQILDLAVQRGTQEAAR